MAIYIRDGGIQKQPSMVYIRVNGVYRTVTNVYTRVNDGGGTHTYHNVYSYDVTPPDPPETSLEIIDSSSTDAHWVKVGVRANGTSNDPHLRRIRVLTNYAGAAPTGHEGGTYTSDSDADWPNEPWSEWRYNSYGDHTDTSAWTYKEWPVNAGPNNGAGYDKDLFFTAWAQDDHGNWSTATAASVHMPKKGVDAANIIVREANFQPNQSGSWTNTGYHGGDLIQNDSPRSVGLFLYGNQLTDSIGSHGAATIRSAQIWLSRPQNDVGAAAANLYLYWSTYGAPGDLPSAGSSISKHDQTKLDNTIAKGYANWFTVPDTFFDNFTGHGGATRIHSLGLDWKDPVKAGAFPNDQSTIDGIGKNPKNGQLHITWQEQV